MKRDLTYIYRLMVLKPGRDWEPYFSWTSRSGRPYSSISTARGQLTRERNDVITSYGPPHSLWQFKLQRSPVGEWEDID